MESVKVTSALCSMSATSAPCHCDTVKSFEETIYCKVLFMHAISLHLYELEDVSVNSIITLVLVLQELKCRCFLLYQLLYNTLSLPTLLITLKHEKVPSFGMFLYSNSGLCQWSKYTVRQTSGTQVLNKTWKKQNFIIPHFVRLLFREL